MTQLEKTAKRALEALEWYVKNDDVIESMPGNEFWVKGKQEAEKAIKELRTAIQQAAETEPVKAEPCGIGGMAKTTCPWCENGFSFEYQPDTTERKEPLSKDQIREVFLAHGFTVKEGQTDLKPYVYDAAYALIALVQQPTERKGEPIGEIVRSFGTGSGLEVRLFGGLTSDTPGIIGTKLYASPQETELKGEPPELVPREWRQALRKLAFMARTSGGTSGPDAGLQAALQEAEEMLAKPYSHTSPQVPEGFALVPVDFLRGFRTLAHNYSLTAEPPFYYRGIEASAFSEAYRRCGEDLARLRAMIDAARKGE